MHACDVQAAQLRTAAEQRVLAQQLQQAGEKRERDAALRSLYTNPLTPQYFAQFETSHR